MAKSTTETLTEEARNLASSLTNKVGSWVEDLLEQASDHAPDPDAVRSSAEKTLKDVTNWMEDLPAKVGSMLPVAQKKKPKTGRAVVGGVAIGATAVYFFDPKEGAKRRSKIIDMVKGSLGSSRPASKPTPSYASTGSTNGSDAHKADQPSV